MKGETDTTEIALGLEKIEKLIKKGMPGDWKIEKVKELVLEMLDLAKKFREAVREEVEETDTTAEDKRVGKDHIKNMTEVIKALENAKTEINKWSGHVSTLEKAIEKEEENKKMLTNVKTKPEEVKEKLQMLADIEKKIEKYKEQKAKIIEYIKQLLI